MSEFDNLIRKYGGGVKEASPITTPYSNLIERYGSGEIKTEPLPIPDADDYYPKPGRAITQDNSVSSPIVEDIKNAPSYIVRQTIKNFQESKALAGKGLTDIAKGMSATGLGETLMGGLGMTVSPISATIQGIDRFAQKSTGNPNFRPAELMATTGLPLKQTTGAVINAAPSSRALNEIVNLVGKENLPKVINELRSNPRLTLMDIDPNVQITTQGLASKPGEPLALLKDFVTKRKDEQQGTVIQAYDEAMGVPVGMKQNVDKLKLQIKNAGKEINPIIAQTKPVDVTPIITSIDEKLKPGVMSVITAGEPLPGPRVIEELKHFRQYLTNDKSVRTNPDELHRLQSGLRAKAENLLNSQKGEDRNVGYALMNVRNQIVNAIDKASPQIIDAKGNSIGSYKGKLAKYREANDIDDAFQKGMLVTKNRLGRLEDHPEYWDEWVKNATPAELEAARQGARLAVAHQMGAFRFASRKGMEIPESEFNAEKLKLLFGKKEVDDLMKALQDERRINDTDTKLFQNSQTAMREAGKIATAVREGYKPNAQAFLPAAAELGAAYMTSGASAGLVAPAMVGYHVARKSINKIGQRLDRKTNVEIAKLASATGEAKEALIKALQDRLPSNKLTMKQKLQLAFPVNP